MQIGSLGDTVFEVSSGKILTPSDFQMDRSAKYEDHEVQGSYPRSEFLAPDLANIKLSIVLRSDLGCVPIEEAEALEYKMVDGEVLRLIICGKNLGKWTIRKVDQSWKNAIRHEIGPMKITLNIELKEYF